MKRILFCASVLALAASCTDELETASSIQQGQVAGITFTAMDADAPATRGEYEEGDKVWYPFWTAETDKIKIFATDVKKGATPWDVNVLKNDYNASYKATRSERNAYFTAVSDDELLNFAEDVDEEEPATFLAVYPSGVELTNEVTVDWENGFDVTLTLPKLSSTQTQTNTSGAGVYDINAKYAITTGYPAADNKVAVGENVPLSFNRLLTGLVFQTKGIDIYTGDEEGEGTIFGNLESVTFETKGEYKDGEAVDDGEKASNLTYSNATTTVHVNPDGTTKAATAFTGSGSKITLNMGNATPDGLVWKDDARAYMIICPVKRVAAGEAWNEGMEVTYSFENIEFVQTVETSNSWVAGSFYRVPALDMSEYKWLVTKATDYDATGLTLILNEGADFDKIYDADTKTVSWKWESNKTVNATYITRIISNIDLTDEQLQTIGNDFTALKDVTYNAETSIPAYAFKSQAEKIENLVMPKVTSIDPKFSNNGTENKALKALKNLNLESYTFPVSETNHLIFNGMGLTTPANSALETVNMKGVTDMSANFNMNRTISFENFTALEKVEMGENVIVSQKAFKNCTALLSITGTLDLGTANAVEAFYFAGRGATSSDAIEYDPEKPEESFNTINLSNDEIPAYAFIGATAMVNILKDGKQVVPTRIGTEAFKNAYSLEYMDLSKAVTIGSNAFYGAKNYKGVEKDNPRVDINAAVLEPGILAATQVVNVYFGGTLSEDGKTPENITLNGEIFNKANTTLAQIEFAKVFKVGTDKKIAWSAYAFGVNSKQYVDLFIKSAQKGTYYNLDKANILSLPYYLANGNVAGENDVTFKSVKLK